LSCGFGQLSPEPLDDMWQLVYPLSSFLAIFIIESFLEAIDYHAIRPLDLTISPWVCNRDIFDLDAHIFIELLELVGREV
jgi:low affinity Fe/Cu permease